MLTGMADTSTLSALAADRTHDLASETALRAAYHSGPAVQRLDSSTIVGRAYDAALQARQAATLY